MIFPWLFIIYTFLVIYQVFHDFQSLWEPYYLVTIHKDMFSSVKAHKDPARWKPVFKDGFVFLLTIRFQILIFKNLPEVPNNPEMQHNMISL